MNDPATMSQEELTKLGETLLDHHKQQHAPGSWERAAYEGSLGMLATFPHQPWWKRAWGALRKKRAERALRLLKR